MADTHLITECGTCRSTDLTSILWLGFHQLACTMQPIDEQAQEETRYPLELMQCNECGLAQLSCIVDPHIVFHRNYPYSSGNSKGLHADFEDLVDGITQHVTSGTVYDIGANDGTLLSKFPAEQWLRVGVEPTNQAYKCHKRGIQAYVSGFNRSLVTGLLLHNEGRADVVTACNVLAHVEDIHDLLLGVHDLLTEDGLFVSENHDFNVIVEGNQWDTIYHEHLRFYTPKTFEHLLNAHGFVVNHVEHIDTHGGSFRTYAHKTPMPPIDTEFECVSDYFAQGVRSSGREIRREVLRASELGSVWGIGAAARAATVIQYCGLTEDDIEFVCEVPTSDKIGHYMPGTRIPVIDEAELFEQQPETVILFSWHMYDYIVPNLRANGYTGDIIVPLPETWRDSC